MIGGSKKNRRTQHFYNSILRQSAVEIYLHGVTPNVLTSIILPPFKPSSLIYPDSTKENDDSTFTRISDCNFAVLNRVVVVFVSVITEK